MTVAHDDSDFTRNLGRNLAIGLILTYAATVGLCYGAAGDLGQAAAIAGLPALFAGPYVGLLITLIAAVNPNRATTATSIHKPVVATSDLVDAPAA